LVRVQDKAEHHDSKDRRHRDRIEKRVGAKIYHSKAFFSDLLPPTRAYLQIIPPDFEPISGLIH
jgi:hypothetical protein